MLLDEGSVFTKSSFGDALSVDGFLSTSDEIASFNDSNDLFTSLGSGYSCSNNACASTRALLN